MFMIRDSMKPSGTSQYRRNHHTVNSIPGSKWMDKRCTHLDNPQEGRLPSRWGIKNWLLGETMFSAKMCGGQKRTSAGLPFDNWHQTTKWMFLPLVPDGLADLLQQSFCWNKKQTIKGTITPSIWRSVVSMNRGGDIASTCLSRNCTAVIISFINIKNQPVNISGKMRYVRQTASSSRCWLLTSLFLCPYPKGHKVYRKMEGGGGVPYLSSHTSKTMEAECPSNKVAVQSL